MADIDVERKSSPTWIWWLLGLLILGAILWALLGRGDDTDTADTIQPAPVGVPADTGIAGGMDAMPAEVQAFMSECTEQTGTPAADMGREHEYTVNCLQRLRESLAAVTQRDTVGGVIVEQRLDEFEQAVTRLEESDPEATTHAARTRDAAMAGATVMEGVRDARFQDVADARTAIDEVGEAARRISPDTQLLEQRDAVRGFFREAGEALRAMWEGSGTATI